MHIYTYVCLYFYSPRVAFKLLWYPQLSILIFISLMWSDRLANFAPGFKPFTVEVQWLLLLFKLIPAAKLTSAHFYFNVAQMSMSVSAVNTLAAVQPHVPTLLDPTHVPVTVALQEMDKLAT